MFKKETRPTLYPTWNTLRPFCGWENKRSKQTMTVSLGGGRLRCRCAAHNHRVTIPLLMRQPALGSVLWCFFLSRSGQ